jgi:phospholipase/carboxylesterase
MQSDKETIILRNHVVRVEKPASNEAEGVILLLHGLLGNEDSMWIFRTRLPESCCIAAPRGIFKVGPENYSWADKQETGYPSVTDFDDSIGAINEILEEFRKNVLDFDQISIVGFSQGAALGYAYLYKFPGRVYKMAALSGFLPQGLSRKDSRNTHLMNKEIFIAHGTEDAIVPEKYALEAVQYLKEEGANVVYCVDDVGHKLSASCFRGLSKFLHC